MDDIVLENLELCDVILNHTKYSCLLDGDYIMGMSFCDEVMLGKVYKNYAVIYILSNGMISGVEKYIAEKDKDEFHILGTSKTITIEPKLNVSIEIPNPNYIDIDYENPNELDKIFMQTDINKDVLEYIVIPAREEEEVISEKLSLYDKIATSLNNFSLLDLKNSLLILTIYKELFDYDKAFIALGDYQNIDVIMAQKLNKRLY